MNAVVICEEMSPAMNSLVQVMHTADRERWCVSKWCTTCGHREFADALVQTESAPHNTIALSLAEINFTELQAAPNWRDCLQSIFQRRRPAERRPILSPIERQRVLVRWSIRLLQSGDLETRLTDFAMFYLVRNEPPSSEALSRWVEHSLRLLRATRDRSLAETLIYFVRRHECFRDIVLQVVLEHGLQDPVIGAALAKLSVPEGK